MNKSIIISYRQSSEERRNNLMMVLDYLSYLQDGKTEIIIVEQDDISKMDWLNTVKNREFIKHIFVKNDGIFNKGWGYNIGAKESITDILIFNDCDMFIKPQTINIAIKSLSNYDVVNPYRSVVFLSNESTQLFKKSNYSFSIANRHKPVLHTIITGGIFFIKKEKFFELKGFDEDCYGYGHEDDILDEKIRKLGLKLHSINDVSIHIYHESSVNNEGIYYKFKELNKQLFAEYKQMSKEEIKNKINNIESWGDVNDSKSNEVSIRHIKRQLFEDTSKMIVEHTLSKFDDNFIDEIVNDISSKIYNDIVESVSIKVKEELKNMQYSDIEKDNMLRKVMKKFRL